MRVLVIGASGAIGTRLVPQLIDRGHEVIGTSSSPGNADRVRRLGAEPIVLDLLDPLAVRMAVIGTEPDAIVNRSDRSGGREVLQEPRPQLRADEPASDGRAPMRSWPPRARQA